MKTDPLRLFQGSLDIRVLGDAGAFLDAALNQGLELTDICLDSRGCSARLAYDQLPLLRRAARDSRCRVRFVRRRGLPFFQALLRRRPLLPLAALLALLLMLFLSTLVVEVTVAGEGPLSDQELQQVLDLAAAAGLKPGVTRLRVDVEQVEAYLLHAMPQLFYVEAKVRGQRVELAVARRVDVTPTEARKPPGNVVALADGVIIDVLVRRGTAAVASGQPVQKGDVLIYGYSGLSAEPVAADGIVTARIWASGYGECPLKETGMLKTGKSAWSASEITFANGQTWVVQGGGESPFGLFVQERLRADACLWRNLSLPVEVVTTAFHELEAKTTVYGPEKAQALARKRAELNARKALFAQYDIAVTRIVETRVDDIRLEESLRRASVTLEAQTELGGFQPAAASGP